MTTEQSNAQSLGTPITIPLRNLRPGDHVTNEKGEPVFYVAQEFSLVLHGAMTSYGRKPEEVDRFSVAGYASLRFDNPRLRLTVHDTGELAYIVDIKTRERYDEDGAKFPGLAPNNVYAVFNTTN